MPLPKLRVTTPQEGYSFGDSNAVLRAKLSSGPSRTRLDMLDAVIEGGVTLLLDPEEYGYWQAFYRSTIKLGVFPFLIDLVLDNADVAEYEIKIIPGTMQTSIQGTAHAIQMQVEIKPQEIDTDYDQAIVTMYELYGVQGGLFLNRLQRLANFELPDV